MFYKLYMKSETTNGENYSSTTMDDAFRNFQMHPLIFRPKARSRYDGEGGEVINFLITIKKYVVQM